MQRATSSTSSPQLPPSSASAAATAPPMTPYSQTLREPVTPLSTTSFVPPPLSSLNNNPTFIDVAALLTMARAGQQIEWSGRLLKRILDAIVEGEYQRDAQVFIKNGPFLSSLVQLVHFMPFTFHSDAWSELVCLIAKNNHNLSVASKLGLVGKLLRYYRFSSDGYIRENLLRIMELLGSFNISTREVKQMFMFMRLHRDELQPQDLLLLLKAVKNMTISEGPQAFFDFSGELSGISIPPILWPYQHGYTFSTWVRIERLPAESFTHQTWPWQTELPPLHRPHLYSFKNKAHGGGFACYLENRAGTTKLYVETVAQGGRQEVFETSTPIEPSVWLHVAVSHVYHRLTTSVVTVYINGKLESTGKLKLPYISEPMDSCLVGASVLKDPKMCLHGQMGAIYLFGEALNAQHVQTIYSLGPSYCNVFSSQTAADDGFPFSPTRSLLQDTKLSSKIIATYNARACISPSCWDQTPASNTQCFVGPNANATMRLGTVAVQSSAFKDVIRAVGGVKTLFPLFALLAPGDFQGVRGRGSFAVKELASVVETPATAAGSSFSIDEAMVSPAKAPPSKQTTLVNSKILIALMEILTSLLDNSAENQKDLLNSHGFLIIGYIVERAWSKCITLDVAVSFKKLAQVLVNTGPSEAGKAERVKLLTELYTLVFFNWRIWINAEASVQRELLSDLTMQSAERPVIDFRRVIGFQPLLDILSEHFWFQPNDRRKNVAAFDDYMSDVGLVSSMAVVQGDGRSLEKADIHELRAYVLFLFKQVVTSRKEETVMEEDELRRVIVYINSIMQDDDQLVDFVPLVVALLTEQPSSVTELFLDLDGLKVMVSMLASKNELVRIYFLKLLATVHRRLGPNRRRLIEDLKAGGYVLMGHLLRKWAVTKLAYNALFEVLTGTVRKEQNGDETSLLLDGSERFHNAAALEMVLDVLASFATLRDENGNRIAMIMLNDVKALLALSQDNRDTLMAIENWQELLLGFLQLPKQPTSATAVTTAAPSAAAAAAAGHSNEETNEMLLMALRSSTSTPSVVTASTTTTTTAAATVTAPPAYNAAMKLPTATLDDLPLTMSYDDVDGSVVSATAAVSAADLSPSSSPSSNIASTVSPRMHRKTLPRGWLVKEDAESKRKVFINTLMRQTTFDDPRVLKSVLPTDVNEGPLVAAVYTIFGFMYDELVRGRKDAAQLWERPLSVLAHVDPASKVFYTSPVTIRKRLYSLLLSPAVLQALQAHLRDLHFNYKSRDVLVRSRDVQLLCENVFRILVCASVDLLGITESTLSTGANANTGSIRHLLTATQDMPLLRQLLEAGDFFVVVGPTADLVGGGSSQEELLLDVQLQLIFVLLECKASIEHLQTIDSRDIDRIRSALKKLVVAATTPGDMAKPASGDDNLLRRVLSVLYVMTHLVLYLHHHDSSYGGATAGTPTSTTPPPPQPAPASVVQSGPQTVTPATATLSVPIANYLRQFLSDRMPLLLSIPAAADVNEMLQSANTTVDTFLAYILSGEWELFVGDHCAPAYQASLVRLGALVELPSAAKVLNEIPERKRVKADLQDTTWRLAKAATFYYNDMDSGRRQQRSEAELQDRALISEELRMIRRQQEDPEGAWTGSYHIHDAQDPPPPEKVFWKLDKFEDSSRRRRRLKRNYKGTTHPEAVILPEDGLGSGASTPRPSEKESLDLALAHGVKRTASIDPARTPDSIRDRDPELGDDNIGSDFVNISADALVPTTDELQTVLTVPVELVSANQVIVGELSVTANPAKLRFIGDSYKEEPNRKLLSHHKFKTWAVDMIDAVYERRYVLADSAMELFLKTQETVLFNFVGDAQSAPSQPQQSQQQQGQGQGQEGTGSSSSSSTSHHSARRIRGKVMKAISNRHNTINPLTILSTQLVGSQLGASVKAFFKKSQLTSRWQHHQISNFEYLLQLNTLSGRSYNDLSQWPVFPWILQNYTSATLDLSDPANYRDLSKPVGALNPDRLKFFRERYQSWDDPDIPRFLYGSHYSNLGAVLYFLVRLEPFTRYLLKLQGGKFDQPGRTFFSVAQAWSNVLQSTSDMKELIPEFFCTPDFLVNSNDYDFGRVDGDLKIGDVILPPWASSPEEFIAIHRAALESDYVSEHLHMWIDLIFGYKQRGKEAEAADNVFYYLTYEGAFDIESVEDPLMRKALQDQVANYGQTPTQLFMSPHPKRDASPLWPPWAPVQAERRIVWSDDHLRGPLTSYPVSSTSALVFVAVDSPFSFSSSASNSATSSFNPTSAASYPASWSQPPQRILCITADGSYSVHRVNVRKADPKMPVTKGTPLPLSLELEGDPLQRRHLPLPFADGVVPSKSLFAWLPEQRLIISAGHWDATVKVTSADTSRVVQTRHLDDVATSMVFVDGNTLVLGQRTGAIVLYDVNPKASATKPLAENPRFVLVGHDFPIMDIKVLPDLDMIVSTSLSGVYLHSLQRGEFVRVIHHPRNRQAQLVQVSPQGIIVYYGGNYKQLCFYTVNGKLLWSQPLEESLLAMALSADGRLLLTGGLGKVLTAYVVTYKGLTAIQSSAPLDASIRVVSWCETEQAFYAMVGLSTGSVALFAVEPAKAVKHLTPDVFWT